MRRTDETPYIASPAGITTGEAAAKTGAAPSAAAAVSPTATAPPTTPAFTVFTHASWAASFFEILPLATRIAPTVALTGSSIAAASTAALPPAFRPCLPNFFDDIRSVRGVGPQPVGFCHVRAASPQVSPGGLPNKIVDALCLARCVRYRLDVTAVLAFYVAAHGLTAHVANRPRHGAAKHLLSFIGRSHPPTISKSRPLKLKSHSGVETGVGCRFGGRCSHCGDHPAHLSRILSTSASSPYVERVPEHVLAQAYRMIARRAFVQPPIFARAWAANGVLRDAYS